ncbi:putative polygalacturonase [Morus notabilis]|uniref:Putative polygalacturonase n=1 Tax=Morus notabilis TaxID=981085 RepID=W9SP40_9ROSA|nr:putative polygalacturonase [Morus notabilis]
MHIRGTSATEEAIKFSCSNSMPCEGLYLEDIQLWSRKGKRTRAFCWEAYGTSSGVVYPPVSIFPSEGFIKKYGSSETYSILQSS